MIALLLTVTLDLIGATAIKPVTETVHDWPALRLNGGRAHEPPPVVLRDSTNTGRVPTIELILSVPVPLLLIVSA